MDNIAKLIDESGLNDERKLALRNSFDDFIAIAQEWEQKAKEIVVTDSSQKDLMKLAKEGRLLLRKKRLDIEEIRKAIKEQPLRECQAIDGVAKAFKELISPIEEYLKVQEEFEKREEEKRVADLIAQRTSELTQYGVDCTYLSLGDMPQPMYEMMLESSKIMYEKKLEDERLEAERKKAEAEAEEKRLEEQRLENERLRKLAKEQEEALRVEREKAQAEAKKAREEQDAKLREEREKAEAKRLELLKEQQEKERKVREEFEAKQKEFEAQQRAKADAERIKLEKLAKKEKVDSFFAKHESQIIEKFTEKANGDENALKFMQDALDIIKEVMSK